MFGLTDGSRDWIIKSSYIQQLLRFIVKVKSLLIIMKNSDADLFEELCVS